MEQLPEHEMIARRKRGTIGFFDRVASQYDRSGPRFFSHFGSRLVELADLPQGGCVLDVAAGRGAVLFPAARAVGLQGQVTGVDISPGMVNELNTEIRQSGAANSRALVMDVEELQFGDKSFDAVLCGFAVFFFPRVELALKEMRRVLRPGGKLAVSVWDRSMDEQWTWFFQAAAKRLADSPEGKPPQARPPSQNLDSTAGLVEVLRQAGFEQIQAALETLDVVYAENEDWWQALWMHWTRTALEQIQRACGEAGLAQFKDEIMAHLAERRQPDGIHQLFPAVLVTAVKPAS